MSRITNDHFPQVAVDWLIGNRSGETLAIEANGPVVRRLLNQGRPLCIATQNLAVNALPAAKTASLQTVAATPDALPFAARTFTTVLVSSPTSATTTEPALAEFARVLTTGGCLAIHAIARDDSVPWVRRLAAILQTVDPTAMTTNSADCVIWPQENPFFPHVQKHQFRMWVPMAREALLAQVVANEKVAQLDPETKTTLLAEVEELYHTSARPPEPLLLPYSVLGWQAEVDEHRLSGANFRNQNDGFCIEF